MAKIEELVYNLALPLIEEQDLELVDVQYIKEGSQWFLRIFIDKSQGIELADCEKISKILDGKLDEIEYIEPAYHLEVSSPGIERPLKRTKDFERFIGSIVQVTTYIAIENQKKHIGELVSITNDQVVINANNIEVIIPRDKIAKANLVWIEDES